ncbi:MAG: hypothetical protein IJD92_04540 [Bacilli bacterium]|nr:hypothetical protein [Bacilli bacterium]
MKAKKILLIISIIVFIYFVGGIVYSFTKNEFIDKKIDKNVTIRGYSYILHDNDTSIYKDEFKKLKSNLENESIDYLEYAKSVSKMFIIDLYSLSNKKNMYDIGGVEFVYPSIVDNYKLNVENTLYKYMEDNSDGERKQELPLVKKVIIDSIEENTFVLGEEEYSGYKANLSIEYVKDLKYDTKAEVVMIKVDSYLYVVEKN